MKKSTLIMILSLVLAVAIGVGSTMAYLQDTDEDVNVMTLGSVYITQNEQERDADGNLVPFTPNKPAYPAVGPIKWAEAGKGVVVNGTEYKVFTDELQNVVDKIVTVTNTGKSDAYIRTIVAIEAPDYDPTDLIHINYNGTDVATSAPVFFTRDGVKYVCFCYTYHEALAPQETSAPSLVQLFLDSKATNADVEKFGDTWEVLVLSQAVQTQGFANAETALNTAFEEVNAENVAKWFGADFGKNIGTPGEEWPNNNPPLEVDGHAANKSEMKNIIEAALAEGQTEIVVDAKDEEFLNLYYALNGKLVPEGVTLYLNNAKITENCYGNGVNGTVVFNNCTFENAGGPYSIHFDSGKGNVIFNDCTLKGWCSFGSAIKSVEMNNCTIEGNGIYAIVRFYQNAKLTNCTIDCGNTNTDDVFTDGVSSVGGTVELVNCTVKNAQYEIDDGCKILVDGVEPEYI